ncbi:MAG: DUF1206 domain-containing protein [Ilumatobacteraceae bacterium]
MSSIRHEMGSMHNPVGKLTAEHPGVVKVARAGWFAKGVVYVIGGYLALSVAAKASGWTDASSTTGDQEASPVGAIKTVAGSGPGTLLLWLLAIGMLLYAAWRVVSAVLPGGTDAKAMAHRIGYIASAVMYTTLAISAIALARNAAANPDGNKKVTDISEKVMTHSFGRVVIGILGIIVIAVGLYRISKGVKLDMEDELDMSSASPTFRQWIERLGAVGEIGRGVGFALVGFFLLRAAMTYDPSKATGLDGAMRRMASEATWGVIVVVVVGIGFAAYGIFCLATFTRRRLEAP